MQLKARGLTYQDKRNWGGCLWIVGDHGLDAFIQECRIKGYKLSYKADGCKTYPNRPVWWTKDHVAKEADTKAVDTLNTMTIKDVAIKVLHDAGHPLTIPEIMQQIEVGQLYKFNSSNPALIVYQGIRRYCKGMKAPNHAPVDVFDRFTDETGQIRYMLIGESQKVTGNTETQETASADDRWLPILQDSFPDGYILNDFLGQFQAAAFWQERYGEVCSIQGDAIDAAMKAIGVVRDSRVFAKKDEDKQLISAICAEINDILSRYTTVYQSCIYDRYQEQLAGCSIYTEQVMVQQLLSEANGTFYSANQVFTKQGQYVSVIQDARKVLRDHGGPMPVSDVAKVLWFIPHDTIYHCLSADDESLNMLPLQTNLKTRC